MNISKTPISPGAYRFVVSDELAGQRLDQYIPAADEKFSRGLAKKLIDLGGVHYAGRRTRRCSQIVENGQPVEIFVDDLPLQPSALADERIIYRDTDIIVINKPAGMPTQPTPSRYQGTLFAELQQLLKNSRRKDLQPSIGMVQRLDRDTSGVMVFSIHKRAHKKLTEQFRTHSVDKQYLALVAGQPEQQQGVIISHLAKRRSNNLMVSVEKGGKYAETRYRTLESGPAASLVEVQLMTGRSHQIRAHFSENGHPLLGDRAYGGAKTLGGLTFSRQMLHAARLCFEHPVTARQMSFDVTPPEDFVNAMTSLFGCLNRPTG